MIVRMWEARAATGKLADLVTWVCDTALPRLEQEPMHMSSEVFSSADSRVVVISRWRNTPQALPAPPVYLIARDPHSWDFTPVLR